MSARVFHAHLWGLREVHAPGPDGQPRLAGGKYHELYETDVSTTGWAEIHPQSPFYLFVPQDTELLAEYERGWKLTEVMAVFSVGVATARDRLTIRWNAAEVWDVIRDFAALDVADARRKYDLGPDVQDWTVASAQADLRRAGLAKNMITPMLYRPFDVRYTYYTGQSRGFLCRPRPEVMRHVLAGPNLGLITSRLTKGESFAHAQVTTVITEVICMSPKTSNNGFLFPLYRYPDPTRQTGQGDAWAPDEKGRRPNLSPAFVEELEGRLALVFVTKTTADPQTTFGPADVFNYIYATLHSPTYRRRYAEFLKIDFPRIPLTRDRELFRRLCGLGAELVALHLMERHGPNVTTFPVAGDNLVEKVRYGEPIARTPGRVWINKTQYFEGVPPKVWAFHVGGYQVCEKWLKDRKGRRLSYDDLTHYQRIVAALGETIRLMAEIDAAIPRWPLP